MISTFIYGIMTIFDTFIFITNLDIIGYKLRIDLFLCNKKSDKLHNIEPTSTFQRIFKKSRKKCEVFNIACKILFLSKHFSVHLINEANKDYVMIENEKTFFFPAH